VFISGRRIHFLTLFIAFLRLAMVQGCFIQCGLISGRFRISLYGRFWISFGGRSHVVPVKALYTWKGWKHYADELSAETGLSYFSRGYLAVANPQRTGVRKTCWQLWHRPQINWDGR